jgi:chromosome segregation ATPase
VEDTLAIFQMDLAAAEGRERGLERGLAVERGKANELTASVASLEEFQTILREEVTTAAATIAKTTTQLSEAKSEVAQLEVQVEVVAKEREELVQEPTSGS